MRLRVIEQGAMTTICAEVNDRDRCPVEKQLLELERSRPHGLQAATTFRAKMKAIAAYGTASQESRFLRRLRSGIWEFRCNGKERMLAWETPGGEIVVIDVVLGDAKGGQGKFQQEKINDLVNRYDSLINEWNSGIVLFE